MTAPLPPSRSTGRRAAEVAAPAAATIVAIVAPLLVLGRLPDPVAAHWSAAGRPDGSLPLVADVVLLALVTAVVALGPLVAARGDVPRDLARVLVGVAGGGGVFLAGLRVASLQANLDAPTWDAASPLPGTTVAVTLVAALVVGAVGAWAAGDRPARIPELRAPADVEVRPGEPVVWSGTATSRVGTQVAAAALGLLALGALLVPAAARIPVLVLLVVSAVAAATLGQVRVTIGPAGLTARLGGIGLPRVHVPITDVEAVRVEDVVPSAYGGWGYRLVPGATALVVRRGPGVRVERRSRRALVVTVDGAAEAAGVLLAHLDAATDGTAP